MLEGAAEKLASVVKGYSGTYDVEDGTAKGKEQLDLILRPEARSLGLVGAIEATGIYPEFTYI